MAEREKLLVSLQNGIKRIFINRPERRNAMDDETFDLLYQAMAGSARDESNVIILSGTGEAFCSGADLHEHRREEMDAYDITSALRKTVNATILAMRRLPKPVIARVHGAAVGVGCNYALACDMRVASDQARLGQVFIRIGLMPDGGGTHLLPGLVGYGKAFELMATGEILEAREALTLGLVNRVVPLDRLDSAVDALAARLAAAPSLALRKIKEALNRNELAALESALEFEAVNQQECFRSEDFLEGLRAFLEKRSPSFRAK